MHPETLAYTIPGAVKASGMSRSRIYQAIAAKQIEAKKAGRRTLIIAESLNRYLHDLPGASSR